MASNPLLQLVARAIAGQVLRQAAAQAAAVKEPVARELLGQTVSRETIRATGIEPDAVTVARPKGQRPKLGPN